MKQFDTIPYPVYCSYGCGQLAIKKFKNGKYCCATTTNKCPNIGKKLSEAIKKSWENDESRRLLASTKMSETMNDTIYKNKQSKRMKKAWTDAAYREKHITYLLNNENRKKINKTISSDENRKKKSELITNLWKNNEYRQHMSMKRKQVWEDDAYKEKMSKMHKKRLSNSDTRRSYLYFDKKKMNKTEKKLFDLINFLLPNRYKFNYEFKIGKRIPDFIDYENKMIIEHFGNYFHSEAITKMTEIDHETERKEFFKKHGYDTLVIWERELNNEKKLINKILKFNKRRM